VLASRIRVHDRETSLPKLSRADAASERRHSAAATLPRIHEQVANSAEFRR
jgi:hypothetical protein